MIARLASRLRKAFTRASRGELAAASNSDGPAYAAPQPSPQPEAEPEPRTPRPSPDQTGAGAKLGQLSRSRFGPLVGGALIALGGGAFLIGSSLEDRPTRTIGPNRPINAGATDPLDSEAHNSPTLARNPVDLSNLVVVNRIDTPRFSCALHVSHDGGRTWTRFPIPFPSGEEDPPRCFAPDVAFGPEGKMYLSFATLKGPGNVPSAIWITTSDDAGRTFSIPSRALDPLAFQVRLTADPRRRGRIYLSWLQGTATATLAFPNAGNPINSARSDDGGATWQPTVRVSPDSRQRVVAPSPAAGARGELYLLYLDVGDDSLDYHGGHEGKGGEPYQGTWSLVLARSTDEGGTWSESVVDPRVVPTERFIVFFPPYPSVAVDQRSGRIYAGFHDARLGDADVWVWTSEDGGKTFARPNRVNDTRRGDRSSQYLPALAVAPNGRLDVVYYDRRADPENLANQVSLQSSSDKGKTFGRRVRLTDASFDSRVGFGSERGLPDLGSRLALLSTKRRGLAVWTDTRGGTVESNKQDLGRAVIEFAEPVPMRGPLRVGGSVLGAAGAALVAMWVVSLLRSARAGMVAKGRSFTPESSDDEDVPARMVEGG